MEPISESNINSNDNKENSNNKNTNNNNKITFEINPSNSTNSTKSSISNNINIDNNNNNVINTLNAKNDCINRNNCDMDNNKSIDFSNTVKEKLKLNSSSEFILSIDIGGTLTKFCFLLNKSNSALLDFLYSSSELTSKELIQDLDYNKAFFNEDNINYNENTSKDNKHIYSSPLPLDTVLFFSLLPTTLFPTQGLNIIRELKTRFGSFRLDGTGGGPHKFQDEIYSIGFNIHKHDEMRSLVKGYVFMNEFKSFYEVLGKNKKDKKGEIRRKRKEDLSFPHISVNIGSGVSILKVYSPTKFERVGGSLMGGATLIGLANIILDVENYDEVFELAKKGKFENVDIMVRDIYRDTPVEVDKDTTDKKGGINNNGAGDKNKEENVNSKNKVNNNDNKINNDDLEINEIKKFKRRGSGLKDDTSMMENAVASSFGKVHEYIQSGREDKIKKEDIALSLTTMICFNLTQLAVIYAKRNNIKKIYYFGNFTRRGSQAVEALSGSTKFWDKDIEVRFNYFDGFLGSVGNIVDLEKDIEGKKNNDNKNDKNNIDIKE